MVVANYLKFVVKTYCQFALNQWFNWVKASLTQLWKWLLWGWNMMYLSTC